MTVDRKVESACYLFHNQPATHDGDGMPIENKAKIFSEGFTTTRSAD